MVMPRRARALLTLLAALVGGLGLAAVRGCLGATTPGVPPAESMLLVGAQWLLWLVTAYAVALVGGASVLELCGRAGHSRVLFRVVPAALRPTVAAVLGLVVTAGPAAAASPPAPETGPPSPAPHGVTVADPLAWTAPLDAPKQVAGALDGHRLRSAGRTGALLPRRAPPHPPAFRTVRVRVGDCLWSLAADDLAARHAGSRPADVVVAWHRWYAVNRTTIGPDPRLIRPGEVLRVPPPTPPRNPSTRTTGRHP